MKDVRWLNSWVLWVVLLVFLASFACTSEEEPATAPSQPAPAPQATAPAAAPAPTQPAMAKMDAEPEGTLTVALERIGLPQFVPGVIT